MEVTTTLKKIIKAMREHPDAHTICLPGGQGSGKTSAALIILINHALSHPGFDCYVAGKELSKMKVTTIKTFTNIMKDFNLFEESQFKSNVDYIFSNGSHIRFLSLDRPGAYKGNRSDCCLVDEANECGWEAFRELTDRSKKVIVSWNPNFRSFCEDILMKLPDTVTVRTTFEDNEFCPENEKKALLQYKEAAYDKDGNVVNQEFHRLWTIYGLGIPCKAVGAVYTNWEVGEFDENCKTIVYGADFGSNDPSTLVKVGIDKEKKLIYLNELIYERGCGSNDLIKLYKQVLPRQHLVIGDSAAPMTITDLRQSGINIKSCVKGRILDEIQVLQSYKIIVTPNSKHIQEELDSFRYADSDTKTTLVPGNDHTLDAMRYAFMSVYRAPSEETFIIAV